MHGLIVSACVKARSFPVELVAGRRIAVLAPPRDLVIFHVMELSDLYRYLVDWEGESK